MGGVQTPSSSITVADLRVRRPDELAMSFWESVTGDESPGEVAEVLSEVLGPVASARQDAA